jgi:homoserine kinase
MTPRVSVFAPASLSNLGPGFDVLGLALAHPGDWLSGALCDRPGVHIAEVTGDGGALSADATRNVAGVAAQHLLARACRERHAPPTTGVQLSLRKGIPIASGLGGSAASSVAGAVVVNELIGRPFSRLELVESALAGETLAAISAHGDNIVPCLLGGIVLIRSLAPLDVIELPIPGNLHLAVVHPHCLVPTAEARAILRDCRFELADAVANTANIAAFVAALYRDDIELLGRCIADRLVEPLRAPLVPGFERVKAAALAAGALACSISGSGPTLFSVTDSEKAAAKVAAAMQSAFVEATGLASDVFVGRVNGAGAAVLR